MGWGLIATRLALVLGVAGSAASARAALVKKSAVIDGLTVAYQVVLRNAYPAVLAFPPGDQDINLVDGMVDLAWRKRA